MVSGYEAKVTHLSQSGVTLLLSALEQFICVCSGVQRHQCGTGDSVKDGASVRPG